MGHFLDAIAPPLTGDGNFPYPSLVQTNGPGLSSYTFEGPTIIGIPMPGQWLLTKAAREFGLQQQRANFLSGAFIVPKGDPLMEIEYEVRIWESGTMGVFRGLLKTLLKKPVASLGAAIPIAAALGIDDPALKDLGVSYVVVSHIDYPKNPLVASGGKGPWVGHVGFLEYRSGVPALPVPDQGIPDPGAVTPSAASNLGTAQADMTAGAGALQGAAAQALVPPR
jgi:hypothetical protein